MNETVFTNARLITPDAVVEGTLVVRDGRIVSLDNGASSLAERIDLEGDYLMPGLVELHTDNLEKHFIPRPKVLWPQGVPAFFAHDAQIVASGITTVFDALSVGEYHDKGRIAMLGKAVGALNSCRSTGKLRSEHLLHLRCEVADPRMQDLFFPLSDTPALSLVSLMDHTPGQRQWRDTSSYRTYYSNIASWTDEEFEQVVERLQTARDGCAEDNAASVMAFCRERGLPMASHDDTLVEHVEEALGNGIAISEFPTTMEAARHASENGMLVLMGAPNVVRGGSHSGNISALEIAQAGYLGSLSSDYVPVSLLEAAFALSEGGYMSLPAAVGLVTANPAEAVGLADRGSLEVGRRADLECLAGRRGGFLMRQGQLVYVMGASGSGKDSLLQALRPRLRGVPVAFARRYITRPLSAKGERHIAVSPERFEAMAASGEFVMDWRSHGLRYGIGKCVETTLAHGGVVLMNGSREYLPEALRRFPDRIARASMPAQYPDGVRRIDNSGPLVESTEAFYRMVARLIEEKTDFRQ